MRAGLLLAPFVLLAPLPALAQQAQPRVDLTVPDSPTPDKATATPAPVDKSQFDFFNPTPDANLRGFSTDRPTKSYTPITVDAGHVQYETDLVFYSHSNVGGASSQQFTAFDPVIKLGLTDRVEFGLQFGGYNWQSSHVPGGTSHLQGPGDLIVRPKINLFGNEGGIALSLIPYVKFPTAAHGLGNGHVDGGLIAPFSAPLPLGFVLLFVPELDVLRNGANAGHHINFTQEFNISHPIGPKVTVYAEFYSTVGPDRGSPNQYTADVAATYLLTDTLQLDVGANFGLNKAAPNVQAYTGISQRF